MHLLCKAMASIRCGFGRGHGGVRGGRGLIVEVVTSVRFLSPAGCDIVNPDLAPSMTKVWYTRGRVK